MPKPPRRMEVRAQNIDQNRESILAPLPTSTQAPKAHTLNSSLQCACPRCGSTEAVKTAGTPPHFAALRCRICDRFLKWVAKPKSGGAV